MKQLTDESDPFFLYTLKISEEEFQAVKVDQSILVDFAEFPDKYAHPKSVALWFSVRCSCLVAQVSLFPFTQIHGAAQMLCSG